MNEVLGLQYSAASRSMVVTLAEVRESEHVPGTFVRQLGAPEVKASVHIDEIPDDLKGPFENLLNWLCGVAEEKHNAVANNPDAMALKANELFDREEALRARERELADREAKLSAE